jgi:hypothetical protein
VSGEQLPAVNTWVKLMEINCKYVQWLHIPETFIYAKIEALSKIGLCGTKISSVQQLK